MRSLFGSLSVEQPAALPHTAVAAPWPQGALPEETRVTCTACAGTLLLEFGALSRLTGNPVYEERARQATLRVFGAPPHAAGLQDASESGHRRWGITGGGVLPQP